MSNKYKQSRIIPALPQLTFFRVLLTCCAIYFIACSTMQALFLILSILLILHIFLDHYINKSMKLISILLALSVITASINAEQLAWNGQIHEEVGHFKKENNHNKQIVAVDYPQNKATDSISQHQKPNLNDIQKQNATGSQVQDKTANRNIGNHQEAGSQMNKLNFIKEVAQRVESLTKKNKDKLWSANDAEINQDERQTVTNHQNEIVFTLQQNIQHINQQQRISNQKQQLLLKISLLNEPMPVSQLNNLNKQSNFNQHSSSNRQLKEQSIITKNMPHQTQDKKGQTHIQLKNEQNELIKQNFDQAKKKHKSYRSNIPRLRKILNIQPDTEDKDSNIIQTYQDLKEKKIKEQNRHINTIDNMRTEQSAHDLNAKKTQDILFYCLLAFVSIFIALPLIRLLARSSKKQSIKTILSNDEQDSTELTQGEMYETSQ